MQVLAGGGDIFWVVIVVGSMIAQVINAKKKAAQSKQSKTSKPPQSGGLQPNDELRNFLATLSGATQPAAPKPTRVATPPRLPVAAAIKHRPPPQKTPPQKNKEVFLSAYEDMQLEQQPVEKVHIHTKKITGLAAIIRDDLQKIDSTRKAIVLREILGPPIALRKM